MKQRVRSIYTERGVMDQSEFRIPQDVYLHAKRLTLTAGIGAAKSYLELKGYKSDDNDEFIRRMFLGDTNRDDIHLSKCMHCMFRRKCGGSPQGCTAVIDERAPIWKIAFSFSPDRSQGGPRARWVSQYECGWAKWNDGEIQQVAPSKFVIMEDMTGGAMFDWRGMTIRKMNPGHAGLVKSGVLPKAGEIYAEYLKRIAAIVQAITDRLTKGKTPSREKPLAEQLHDIFMGIGQGETLNSLYGGDAIAMCKDYFVGMKPEQVAAQYKQKPSVKIDDDEVRKMAIETAKEARSK